MNICIYNGNLTNVFLCLPISQNGKGHSSVTCAPFGSFPIQHNVRSAKISVCITVRRPKAHQRKYIQRKSDIR